MEDEGYILVVEFRFGCYLGFFVFKFWGVGLGGGVLGDFIGIGRVGFFLVDGVRMGIRVLEVCVFLLKLKS